MRYFAVDAATIAGCIALIVFAFVFERVLYRFRWGLLDESVARIKQGDFEGSLANALKAATDHPGDWQPYINAACACIGLSKYDDALRYCAQAEERKFDGWQLYANRALAKSNLLLPGAIEDAERGVEIIANETTLTYRALVYLRHFKYSEALADCDRALEVSSRSSNVRLVRALVHLSLSAVPSAKTDVDDAFEIMPNSAPFPVVAGALHIQAAVSFALGNWETSIAEITNAIELRPTAGSYISRAAILAATGELKRARSDLTTASALECSPLLEGSRLSTQARIAILEGQLDEAINLSLQALELSERPEYLCSLAAALIRSERIDEAEQKLDRALEIEPANAEVSWLRGHIMELRGNDSEAAALKEKALRNYYHPYL